MKSGLKLLAASFISISGLLPTPLYGDAMDDINGKKGDVQRSLQQIEQDVGRNNGSTVPDSTLENDIGEIETHLHQMDFRLESLPACQKAPVPPGADAAINALKRLSFDESDLQRKKKELEDRIKEIQNRIAFLGFVNQATKNIVKVKAMTAAGGLALNAIPGMGIAFDVMTILDSALSHMGMNPLDPGAPQNVRGLREYHQYLGQNRGDFQNFCQTKMQETLDRDPHYRFTEQDIVWWAHKFVLDKTPRDKQARERELEDAKKELDRVNGDVETLRNKNTYFAGLLARLQAAIDDSKWIQDPSQFEKMKAEIKVTVVDDKDGSVLSSANLKIAPSAGTARTAGNPFEFEGVDFGPYSVTAEAPGYVTATSAVDVTKCQVYGITSRLKKKPVIKVVDVKDKEGHFIDDVKIDVAGISGGGGGSDRYRRVPLSFIVDPGAFTVTGTDTGDMYDPATENVNAEAGAEVEVHLVMTRKGADLIVEVWDNLSKLKIDPPPGAQEPSVQLEPLEGQAAPKREAYIGNGDVPFSHVAAGRLKYTAHFCGWEVQTGEFAVSADDVKTKQVVRRIYLNPTKLDSFVGNVFEHGQSEHIDGFKVVLTGLGPRKGYRYDTVEGKDPNPDVVGLHSGAFVVQGPIYSGHYKLEITRKCFQPLVIEDWWVFCGIEPGSAGTFSPQNFQLHPTAEFDQACQQVRSSAKAMTEQRKKAAEAADQIANGRRGMQDLPQLAQDLINELKQLKQRQPSLEKDCGAAGKLVSDIADASNRLNNAANEITNLRDTAKNLAGVACELSEQAQTVTNATKASNHEHNSKKFADQTRKTAENAQTVAENARKTYDAAAQELTGVKQLEKNVNDLRQAFTSTSTKLQDLRDRLAAADQATKSMSEAEAAATEAARLLASIRQLLQDCGDTHPGQQLLQNADQTNNGVVGERNRAKDELAVLKELQTGAKSVATPADELAQEVEKMLQACANLGGVPDSLDDAKATVETIELFASAAQNSVKAADECANKASNRSPTIASGDLLAVPGVYGLDTAATTISEAGFTPSFAAVTTPSDKPYLELKLAGQNPAAGEMKPRGSVVTVYVYQKASDSAATSTLSPPSVATSDLTAVPAIDKIETASSVINAAGFTPSIAAVPPPNGDTSLEFKLAGQNPAPGEMKPRGSVVTVYVYQKASDLATATPMVVAKVKTSPTPNDGSTDSKTTTMPELRGLTLDQATTRLSKNMRIGGDEIGDKPPTPEKALTIYQQNPPARSKIDSDKTLVVTVRRYGSAQAPEPEPPPEGEGGFVGTWEREGQPPIKIYREGGSYGIAGIAIMGEAATLHDGKVEGASLRFSTEIDMRNAVGFFQEADQKLGNKEDALNVFKWTFTPSGQNLQMNFEWADGHGALVSKGQVDLHRIK